MSLPELSTRPLFLGQALLPASPTPACSQCSPRTGGGSLELRCSTASSTGVSAEVSAAGHTFVHCPALSAPMSPPQELYRCIKIWSKEEAILCHGRQIKNEQQTSVPHVGSLIGCFSLRLQLPVSSSVLLQHSPGPCVHLLLHF